jgi:glycosyltransferase involved in cell wall biosynthesis
LIDAWLRWVEAGGHFDARLFVVGPFTDLSYVEAIRVRVQAGNPAAADTVRLMGLSYDVTMFHRAADVYLTAAYAEGLPISVVEALAHGVPAICRRLDGVTDDFMFGHAVTAVPDWNVDAVVKTLNRFMDSSYRFQAAKDARSVAEARFDIARRVDTILRLLSHPHEALANVA